jgi:hypothetical protein
VREGQFVELGDRKSLISRGEKVLGIRFVGFCDFKRGILVSCLVIAFLASGIRRGRFKVGHPSMPNLHPFSSLKL